jgi:hypothetical protein
MMVWTCFKNEPRENLKEAFDHESEREIPKGRLRSRWEQQVREYVTQREGRPWKKLRVCA